MYPTLTHLSSNWFKERNFNMSQGNKLRPSTKRRLRPSSKRTFDVAQGIEGTLEWSLTLEKLIDLDPLPSQVLRDVKNIDCS